MPRQTIGSERGGQTSQGERQPRYERDEKACPSEDEDVKVGKQVHVRQASGRTFE